MKIRGKWSRILEEEWVTDVDRARSMFMSLRFLLHLLSLLNTMTLNRCQVFDPIKIPTMFIVPKKG